jgi:hypothetical protein
MEIRLYQEADRAGVVALWTDVFPNPAPHNEPGLAFDRKRGVDDGLFFVAVDGRQVVGTVLGGYDGHRGWVYSLAVAPQLRRNGIGRDLMRHLESTLRSLGCVKVNLQVRTKNEHVVAFYEQLGFCVENRISMGKLLGDSRE